MSTAKSDKHRGSNNMEIMKALKISAISSNSYLCKPESILDVTHYANTRRGDISDDPSALKKSTSTIELMIEKKNIAIVIGASSSKPMSFMDITYYNGIARKPVPKVLSNTAVQSTTIAGMKQLKDKSMLASVQFYSKPKSFLDETYHSGIKRQSPYKMYSEYNITSEEIMIMQKNIKMLSRSHDSNSNSFLDTTYHGGFRKRTAPESDLMVCCPSVDKMRLLKINAIKIGVNSSPPKSFLDITHREDLEITGGSTEQALSVPELPLVTPE